MGRRRAGKSVIMLAGIMTLVFFGHSSVRAEGPAKTPEQNDVLFYCSFDDTIEPVIQKGEKGVKANGTVEFTKGLMGKALLTAHDRDVVYPTKGNISVTEGTVKFWVMPVDWAIGDNLLHHFFRIIEQKPEGVLDTRTFGVTLYKYLEWDEIIAFGMNGELTAMGILRVPMDSSWVPKKWHQVVFTWDSQGASLYVDGVGKNWKYLHEAPNTLNAENFIVGGPYFGENKTLTAIDELYIYNRKLSGEEINQMYKREILESVMKR